MKILGVTFWWMRILGIILEVNWDTVIMQVFSKVDLHAERRDYLPRFSEMSSHFDHRNVLTIGHQTIHVWSLLHGLWVEPTKYREADSCPSSVLGLWQKMALLQPEPCALPAILLRDQDCDINA
jgi:hypothetical protein